MLAKVNQASSYEPEMFPRPPRATGRALVWSTDMLPHHIKVQAAPMFTDSLSWYCAPRPKRHAWPIGKVTVRYSLVTAELSKATPPESRHFSDARYCAPIAPCQVS